MEQALFKWRTTAATGIQWGDVCPDEGEPVIELILQREPVRFKADGVRPHLAHPVHEAAMKGPLPRTLRVLRLDGCRIRTFPMLPLSIHEFYASACDFFTLPDLSRYTELIVLSFPDNRIESVCHPLPPTLASLNLACNALREVRCVRPPTLFNIACGGNPTSGIVHIEDWMQTQINDTIPVVIHANEEHIQTVYQDSQNVHASSIQSSTKHNLDLIASYKPDVPQLSRDVILASIREGLKGLDMFRNKGLNLPVVSKINVNLSLFMDELTSRIDTTYAMHGHTVFEIVERLWLRIQDSPHWADILQRFVDEVDDGKHKCVNGFMVRMANVFVGFDDAFVMKLSAKEILQSRIPATIAREQKVSGDAVDIWFRILKQTWDDICEVDITNMSEKRVWIAPLLDELLEAGFAAEIVAIPTFMCTAFSKTNTSESSVEPCGVCMRCFLTTRASHTTGDLAEIVASYCFTNRNSG